MFDLNWRIYRSAQILWAVAALIHIKHGYIKHHQWVIHQRYNLLGHESPSGYGPLVTRLEGCLETNVANFINLPSKKSLITIQNKLLNDIIYDSFRSETKCWQTF